MQLARAWRGVAPLEGSSRSAMTTELRDTRTQHHKQTVILQSAPVRSLWRPPWSGAHGCERSTERRNSGEVTMHQVSSTLRRAADTANASHHREL